MTTIEQFHLEDNTNKQQINCEETEWFTRNMIVPKKKNKKKSKNTPNDYNLASSAKQDHVPETSNTLAQKLFLTLTLGRESRQSQLEMGGNEQRRQLEII